MHHKWIWALALVFLAGLLWILWPDTASQPPMAPADASTMTATTDPEPQTPTESGRQDAADASTKPPTPAVPDQDDGGMSEAALTALLDRLADAQYSDDPLVEAASLIQQHNHCVHQNIRQGIHDDNPISAVSERQQATLDALKLRCEKSKERYPFLGDLHQLNQVMHTLPDLPSRSALGVFYRSHPAAADWHTQMDRLQQRLILGVKERNAQAIMSALDELALNTMKAHPALAQWLGSQDQTYLKWMTRTALGLISCDFNGGITCRPGGALVLDQCLQDERFCALTFAEWYAEINTPAMHSDVQQTIDFYQQQAASISP